MPVPVQKNVLELEYVLDVHFSCQRLVGLDGNCTYFSRYNVFFTPVRQVHFHFIKPLSNISYIQVFFLSRIY